MHCQITRQLSQAFFSTDFRQVDQVDLPKPWLFCLSFWVSSQNFKFFPWVLRNFQRILWLLLPSLSFSPTIHIYNHVFAISVKIAPHFWTYLPYFLHWFLPDLPKPWVLCLSFEFFPWVLSFFILEFFWRGRKKSLD